MKEHADNCEKWTIALNSDGRRLDGSEECNCGFEEYKYCPFCGGFDVKNVGKYLTDTEYVDLIECKDCGSTAKDKKTWNRRKIRYLNEYLDHDEDCPSNDPDEDRTCTCGFEEILMRYEIR
jgi:hypothetical protein